MSEKIDYELSRGNVFVDLELEDAESLQARGMFGFHVVELLKRKKINQKEIGKVLGINQTEISHLLNGHFSCFSLDQLLFFLKCLDQKVSIQISPHQQGEPYHQVGYSS